MTKVKVIKNGLYSGMNKVIGSIVNAVPFYGAFDIPISELVAAGYTNEDELNLNDTLHFFASEVEVIDG